MAPEWRRGRRRTGRPRTTLDARPQFQRQARLATSTGANERDQAGLADETGKLLKLPRSAEKRGESQSRVIARGRHRWSALSSPHSRAIDGVTVSPHA